MQTLKLLLTATLLTILMAAGCQKQALSPQQTEANFSQKLTGTYHVTPIIALNYATPKTEKEKKAQQMSAMLIKLMAFSLTFEANGQALHQAHGKKTPMHWQMKGDTLLLNKTQTPNKKIKYYIKDYEADVSSFKVGVPQPDTAQHKFEGFLFTKTE